MAPLQQDITEFIRRVTAAMGLSLEADVEQTADGWRINLRGDGGETLLARRGEALKALQHVIDTAYRRRLGDQHVHLDCLGYRRDKDAELRQMALYLANKAKETGFDQEIGPLNPYERRIVHIAVAEDPAVTSESIGDAHVKTVIISVKK